MKKILVIGGFGFIGSHLSTSYEKDGFEVFKTSRFYDICESSMSFRSDYSEASFVEILQSNEFDLVFYLSGNPYPGISENNAIYDVQQTITPLVNLLTASVRTKFKGVLWFASSVAVYGKTVNSFQSETDICRPLSSYALAKITGEEYLKLFADKHNLMCGSLRIFSTFGEGLKRQIVYDLYQKAISDSADLQLIGSGREQRDLCYVGDQVERIKILADLLQPSGDIYNIGNGSSISTYKIAKEILEITGISKEVTASDVGRSFDGYQWRSCTKKFASIASNPVTAFSRALKRTIASY